MPGLVVKDLRFARGERPILRGINFEHEQGRILTFLGPSGCGKTTLLWLLARLLKPAGGAIQYDDGRSVPSFGMVFQDGALWEHLTVRQHLEVVLRGRRIDRGNLSSRVEAVLSRTGLTELASRRPGELSGGERQRLALARAMVVEPQWLFLDEPTSQLDGPARQQMIDLLAGQLRATSAGIILATHQVDLAMRVSDTIAILHDGVIAQLGQPEQVYKQPRTLAVARLLGPACEIPASEIRGGPTPAAQDRVIARPQQVRFQPCDLGSARVTACHFAGGFWQVEATLPSGDQALASSASEVPIATRGVLQWVSG